ncbi:electron transporter RnfD [bacterium]|nr:electron transporter RnfD [bacterium]
MKMYHLKRSIPALMFAAVLFRTDLVQPETIIQASHPGFQYTGRIDFSDTLSPVIYWPGSYIKARFQGTSVQVMLDDSTGDNYYSVFIDNDDHPVIIDCGPGFQMTAVAKHLTDTVHQIMIFRRTEGFSGPTRFKGLVLDDGRSLEEPPARPARKIEFYGNSITCGMGNEVPDEEEDENNAKRNNFLAYGAITARALDADYTCIAKSGIGILISWFDMIMPEYYNRLNPWDPDSKWDFTRWTPDLVVINLFQNDSWLIGRLEPVPDEERIVQAYDDFLGLIRGKYPDSPIICTLGSMDATKELSPWPGYVQKAVDQRKKKNKDPNIVTLFFEFDGTYKHPRVRHHKAMADTLTQFIRKNLGWE